MVLIDGVTGWGHLEENDGRRYRSQLGRSWPAEEPVRTILWIGMNPSTADAQYDDRTCRREQNISRRFGFNRYLKGNILDIMATRPRDIPRAIEQARTERNLAAIQEMAREAEWVVLAHGHLPPRFAQAVHEAYEVIRALGKPVAVFQVTGGQIPTHTRRILNASIPANIEDARWNGF